MAQPFSSNHKFVSSTQELFCNTPLAEYLVYSKHREWFGVPWQGNRAVPQTENLIIFTLFFLKTKHRLLMWNTLSHRYPESPVQPGVGSVCVTFWDRGSLWGWAHREVIAPGSNSILTPRKVCKVLGGDNPQAFYFEFIRGKAGLSTAVLSLGCRSRKFSCCCTLQHYQKRSILSYEQQTLPARDFGLCVPPP